MIITTATPDQAVWWFHTKDSQHDILCILVAASKHARVQMQELVSEFYELNAAMGSRVGFLFFYPDMQVSFQQYQSPGKLVLYMGDAINPESAGKVESLTISRDRYRNRPQSPYSTDEQFHLVHLLDNKFISHSAKRVSDETAKFAADFAELFEIDYHDMPALCVLVKAYFDAKIIPLDKSFTSEHIIPWLYKLAKVAGADDNGVAYDFDLLESIDYKLSRIDSYSKDIEAGMSVAAHKLEAMCRRHGGTDKDREIIADFLARRSVNRDPIEKVFPSLSFGPQLSLTGYTKLRRVLSRIDELQSALDGITDGALSKRSVEEHLHTLNLRRTRIAHAVESFHAGNSRTVTPSGISASWPKIQRYADAVNTWSDLLEKLGSAVMWLTKLLS